MSHVGPDAEHWFSLSRELLCTLDREGRVLAANDAWGEVLGYAREALEGMTLASIMHPKDAGRLADVVAGLGEPGAVGDVRVRCASRGGEWRLVSWRARAHGDRVYVVGRDETALLTVEAERDALSARMRGSAQHDQLTGLLTREAWHTWLKHELMRAGRSGMPLGVVLIDIDGFRAMNEARGRGEPTTCCATARGRGGRLSGPPTAWGGSAATTSRCSCPTATWSVRMRCSTGCARRPRRGSPPRWGWPSGARPSRPSGCCCARIVLSMPPSGRGATAWRACARGVTPRGVGQPSRAGSGSG